MTKKFRNLGFIFLIASLSSCGSAKFRSKAEENHYQSAGILDLPSLKTTPSAFEGPDFFSAEKETAFEGQLIQDITTYAKDFQGTRYKFGGTTKQGMDCSGLVYTSFLHENISLPRTSREMALQGQPLSLKDVETGDLLFFETTRKKVVSHVGLVIKTTSDEIIFIHSTTSQGVIISSLSENYWQQHFVMARRII